MPYCWLFWSCVSSRILERLDFFGTCWPPPIMDIALAMLLSRFLDLASRLGGKKAWEYPPSPSKPPGTWNGWFPFFDCHYRSYVVFSVDTPPPFFFLFCLSDEYRLIFFSLWNANDFELCFTVFGCLCMYFTLGWQYVSEEKSPLREKITRHELKEKIVWFHRAHRLLYICFFYVHILSPKWSPSATRYPALSVSFPEN